LDQLTLSGEILPTQSLLGHLSEVHRSVNVEVSRPGDGSPPSVVIVDERVEEIYGERPRIGVGVGGQEEQHTQTLRTWTYYSGSYVLELTEETGRVGHETRMLVSRR
jgi:hypothetical protein